tara:strand:+ start:4304 stop:4966 length:663 start_codon:yes stop_codon:yes gene_type:complete
MEQTVKEKLKCVIFERISNISAEKLPKDSKYPVSLTMTVYPTRPSQLSLTSPTYSDNYIMISKGLASQLSKTITVKGDYAKRGNTNLKTLRLKINKSDWPEEWDFPNTELERRLFLQNFRLTNLDIISGFDEGGEDYEKLFKPEDDEIEIDFEEDSSESSENISQEEESDEKADIQDVFDMLEILEIDTQENEYHEISSLITQIKIEIIKDVLKSRRGEK